MIKSDNQQIGGDHMKYLRIISVLISASLIMSVAVGCKKEETEEPVIFSYEEAQQQQDQGVITFESTEASQTSAASGGETEALAPIIASRDQTEIAATVPTAETITETTTEETASTETTVTETTAAAETTAATQAQTADQGAEVPVVAAGTHIYDNAGVIANEASVNSAMASFESETGVSPAIFTISDSLTGDDFRSYARDVYSSNFDDQDHVVVVYQLNPQGVWSWTCVFGTNTGTVFTQDTIDQFQSDLTGAFSSSNVDNALVTTFDNAATGNT